MASDLREKLEALAVERLGCVEREMIFDAARLALESLPCICDQPQLEPEYRGYICRRCQRLASLASEGKGG